MEKIDYGDPIFNPKIIETFKPILMAKAVWKKMPTKHEGNVLYHKLWNFWVRAGIQADLRSDLFFRDYEKQSPQITQLLKALGYPGTSAVSEIDIWERIGLVWNWLSQNVQQNPAAYVKISSQPNSWPSIDDFAAYFSTHGSLVWAACFSKAHLFASLLGRLVDARYRFGIASAHHTEGNVPSTASHVYAAAYVDDRWFYLDPTEVTTQVFPVFNQRASLGVAAFATVDYEHPFDFIPLPQSTFAAVPYLPV